MKIGLIIGIFLIVFGAAVGLWGGCGAAAAHELEIDRVTQACIELTDVGIGNNQDRIACVKIFLEEASRESEVNLKNRHCKIVICGEGGCRSEAEKRRYAVCMSGS